MGSSGSVEISAAAIQAILKLVSEQANDPAIWDVDAGNFPLGLHLQQALRCLHEIIEVVLGDCEDE